MKQILSIAFILLSLAVFAQEGGADHFRLKTDFLEIENQNLVKLNPATLKVLAIDDDNKVGYTLAGSGDGSSPWFTDSVGGYNYISYNANLGDVRIGVPSDTTLDLFVSGKIYTTEVYVRAAIPAPDYVFEEDYKLIKLDELENYLEENKHLPGIPSGKEMETNGLSLSEMNLLLLKKVEELTLYVINQQKEINLLKSDLNNTKKEN